MHSKSESKFQEIFLEPEVLSNTKQIKSAAAPSTDVIQKKPLLIDQIADALAHMPHLSLHRAVDAVTWLQQTWLEPVSPHTPAWLMITNKQLSDRDLVALILAIWADPTIKHPSRYLSWLVQRWQTSPDIPPVNHWESWRDLADLPLGKWDEQGRRLWLELAPRDNRMLPFGLDAVINQNNDVVDSENSADKQQLFNLAPVEASETVDDGLDERPGNGTLTIRDIWRVTLGQLSVRLNRVTYNNWVEGTKAVSYADGVLTVRARHKMARDLLARHLNESIESTASSLAQQPIAIRYTVDLPRLAASPVWQSDS